MKISVPLHHSWVSNIDLTCTITPNASLERAVKFLLPTAVGVGIGAGGGGAVVVTASVMILSSLE